MRIASEVNFDKNTLQYTDLRLELCENNSFIQDTLIKGDIMESRVSEALCVIEEDKPKMSVLGHFETPKQKLLEVQINRCVNPTALFQPLSERQPTCVPESEIDEFFEKYQFSLFTLKRFVNYEDIGNPMNSIL